MSVGGGDPPSSSSSSSSSSSDSSTSSGSSVSNGSYTLGDSSSDYSSDTPSSTSSSSGRRHRHRRRHKRRRGSKRRRSSRRKRPSKQKVPISKPQDPEPYSGQADLTVFHKFINQMRDYLDEYRVKPRRHAAIVSRFLKDRAHEFYVNTISRNPKAFAFKDILVGLFNYCFPINFRQRMREKLRNTRQNGRTIQAYAYELENLFLILGMDRNEERVDVFWYGLDKYIQSELWKQMM
ncbi:hypothetical protein C8Q74DRAFT_1194553, partial [Fomes fomentarius]